MYDIIERIRNRAVNISGLCHIDGEFNESVNYDRAIFGRYATPYLQALMSKILKIDNDREQERLIDRFMWAIKETKWASNNPRVSVYKYNDLVKFFLVATDNEVKKYYYWEDEMNDGNKRDALKKKVLNKHKDFFKVVRNIKGGQIVDYGN